MPTHNINFSDLSNGTARINNSDITNNSKSLEEILRGAIDNTAITRITFANDLLDDNGALTINLTNSPLTITRDLILDGDVDDNDTPDVTIIAAVNNRVFAVDDGNAQSIINVTLEGLIITGGNVTDQNGGGIFNAENLVIKNSTISGNSAGNQGGGVLNNNGILTVSNSTISDNYAYNGGGVFNSGGTSTVSNSTIFSNSARYGGGVYNNSGTSTVSNSTISGNIANQGGGVFNFSGTSTVSNSTISGNTADFGGGVFNFNGTSTVSNSTISGNSAFFGGGVRNFGGTSIVSNSTIFSNTANYGGGVYNAGGTSTVSNSTISGNTASNNGGGVYNAGGTTNIFSSIIAQNTDNKDLAVDGGTVISQGFNLIGNGDDVTAFINGQNNDIVGTSTNPVDPLLGELKDNGGSTFTMALLEGSPAINKGSNQISPLDFDQRGLSRQSGVSVDIGAFELQKQPSTINVVNGIGTIAKDINGNNIEAVLRNAIANPAITRITFADDLLTEGELTINLETESALEIKRDLIIDGDVNDDGKPDVKIIASPNNRVFTIDDSTSSIINVTLEGLIITDGNIGSGDDGGGIFNSENLIIKNSTISNNSSDNNGGGIFNNEYATMEVMNSTISNNISSNAGGGIFNNQYATTKVMNSTIYNNSSGSNGGGIFNGPDGMIEIMNSTISNNSSSSNGAGIFNYGDATIEIRNSTISGNYASNSSYGGVVNSGTATIFSSIIAQNLSDADISGSGTWISNGFNLIGNRGGVALENFVNTDIIGSGDNIINAQLDTLQDNGGATRTQALLAGSPAINAGNAGGLQFDQRGTPFLRVLQGRADIGAFESEFSTNNGGGGRGNTITPPPTVVVVNPPQPLTLDRNNAQIAYVAYFGRPADPNGLAFWSDVLDSFEISYSPRTGDTLDNQPTEVIDAYLSIINSFGNSEEAGRIFDDLTEPMRINQIYQFNFNRNAEQGGLDYWSEAISNEDVSLAAAALEIALGARGSDITILTNKIRSANLFTNRLNTAGVASAYDGESGEIVGRNFLAQVGNGVASNEMINSAINNLTT